MLRELILHTRRDLDVVSRELLALHPLLARLTTEKALCAADKGKATHCRKFHLLHVTQHLSLPLTKKCFMYFSDVSLEDAAFSALRKCVKSATLQWLLRTFPLKMSRVVWRKP
jgi:hypothetical protein